MEGFGGGGGQGGGEVLEKGLSVGSMNVIDDRIGLEGWREGEGHIPKEMQGVFEGHGGGFEAEEAVFDGCRAGLNEGVDTVDVVPGEVQERVWRGVGKALNITGGEFADTQGAEKRVGVHSALAVDLSESPRADTANEIHLKEAVLSLNITEGMDGVFFALGVDVGDSPGVVVDVHWLGEAREVECTGALGLFGLQVEPGGSGEENQGGAEEHEESLEQSRHERAPYLGGQQRRNTTRQHTREMGTRGRGVSEGRGRGRVA